MSNTETNSTFTHRLLMIILIIFGIANVTFMILSWVYLKPKRLWPYDYSRDYDPSTQAP